MKFPINNVATICVAKFSVKKSVCSVIKLILGGFPSPAQDYIGKNEHLIRNECATFIVRVCSREIWQEKDSHRPLLYSK